MHDLLCKGSQFSMGLGNMYADQYDSFLFLFPWAFQALIRVILALTFLEAVLFTS